MNEHTFCEGCGVELEKRQDANRTYTGSNVVCGMLVCDRCKQFDDNESECEEMS